MLINNWEATYFSFDKEKDPEHRKGASELGVEMLVLDDGWFGKRNGDLSGLGDWYVNTIQAERPETDRQTNQCHGMKFGVSGLSRVYLREPVICTVHIRTGRSDSGKKAEQAAIS